MAAGTTVINAALFRFSGETEWDRLSNRWIDKNAQLEGQERPNDGEDSRHDERKQGEIKKSLMVWHCADPWVDNIELIHNGPKRRQAVKGASNETFEKSLQRQKWGSIIKLDLKQ